MSLVAFFLAPLSTLIERPWLGLLPAAAFGLLFRRARHRLTAAAAVAWLLYAVYEYGMLRRWLCTGECNIRVDLLLVYPALLLLSLVTAVVAFVGIRGRRISSE